MNKKAFNLFTALVAFVLIMLTILLVQSMLGSEDTVISTIARLESQSKLYAVAHVTRADALQIFNYFIRFYIENHITGGGGNYLMDDPNVLRNWDDLQKDYATTYFGGGEGGGDQFARQLALNLRSYFRAKSVFGNYTMELEDRDSDNTRCSAYTDQTNCDNQGCHYDSSNNICVGNSDLLTGVISGTISESINDREFFEVIGCENGDPDNCDPGTFYITFEGSRITDEAYEEVPVLKIVDNSTNEFVKIGIIPRHDFRIYVPLRLFKALAIARDFALNYDELNNLANNYGLLSPRVHNEIEEMKLGFCDKGYCAPRTNPYMPPSSKTWGNKCDGSSTITMDDGLTYISPTMDTRLEDLVKARVCNIANDFSKNDALNGTYDNFTIVGSETAACGSPSKLSSLTIQVIPKHSKEISNPPSGIPAAPIPGNSASYNFNICPLIQNNSFGNPNVALFRTPGNTNMEYYKGTIASCSSSTTTNVTPAECAEVTQVIATLVFLEEDPKYKVVNDPDNVVQFTVEIQDNRYKAFAPTLKPVGLDSQTCLFNSVEFTACNYDDGWACYQSVSPGTGPGFPTGGGTSTSGIQCSPEKNP